MSDDYQRGQFSLLVLQDGHPYNIIKQFDP